jgi:hypothetical protein
MNIIYLIILILQFIIILGLISLLREKKFQSTSITDCSLDIQKEYVELLQKLKADGTGAVMFNNKYYFFHRDLFKKLNGDIVSLKKFEMDFIKSKQISNTAITIDAAINNTNENIKRIEDVIKEL